jgi:DNA-binding CsgD family transcriptional regulator
LLEFLVPHLHAVLVRLTADISITEEEKETNCMISMREREILEWVHHGKTNWEIAGILEISPLTVKNHVQNILRKLNVQNRSHAAVKASRLGLVKV